MFPEVAYSSIEIPLQQDDRYVLYTDGLPESTNAKAEEFAFRVASNFWDLIFVFLQQHWPTSY